MDHEELLEAATANLAGWHDCSVRALGFHTTAGPWWWAAPTPAPWIYFTAVELRRPGSRADRRDALTELRRHLDDPDGSFQAVCETFGAHNLERVGLGRRTRGRWYARPPGPIEPGPSPRAGRAGDREAALAISEVTSPDDLRAFEQATCLAFGSPPPTAPFDIHDPAILDDPRMHVLVGRLVDEDARARPPDRPGAPVVAGAMAFVDERVVGIYGVGTVPGHRRRGHARALTVACLGLAPDRPAILQPSAAAASLYRRLGFVDVGPFTHWG